jgi:asparagine synthase (glutamine-hydrolysing)
VGFNELPYAQRVARDLGTQHHELILGPQSSLELLPRILWHYDEPHGEPTSVLVYLLCEFARQRVKVVLGGTGGDEIFFGYPRHSGIRLLEYYRWLPRTVRKHLVERAVTLWPESTTGSRFAKRAKRFVMGSDLPPAYAYLSWVNLLHADVRHGLLSAQTRAAVEDPLGDRVLRDYLTRPSPDSLLDRAALLDVEGYLPEYQLTYMDRMSMAHGLEVRSPLCDFNLVDFVLSLPAGFRLKGQHSKHILKTVARDWLPSEICERRKVGFDSPIGQWFKGELRPFLHSFLSREQIQRSGLLDGEKVQEVISDHLLGRRDYSLQLWSLIALEAWYRMYIEDGVTNAADYALKNLRGAEQYAVAA